MIQNQTICKSGKIRGEKMKYKNDEEKDKICYTIWKVWKEAEKDEDEIGGPCYDYYEEDKKDIKRIIKMLDAIEPSIYVETEEEKQKEEKFEKVWNHPIRKFIREWLADISFQITIFEWKLGCAHVTRRVSTNGEEIMYKWVEGIHLGPITITIPRNWAMPFEVRNEKNIN